MPRVDANWAWAQLVRQADRRAAGGAVRGDPGTGGGRLFKPETQEAQRQRFADTPLSCNAGLGPTEVRKICRLDETGRGLVKAAMQQLQMSARAFHRILKLARTIADLAGSERIETAHLAEAIQYRPRRVV
jgi:predicted ATPase with chaperone activity